MGLYIKSQCGGHIVDLKILYTVPLAQNKGFHITDSCAILGHFKTKEKAQEQIERIHEAIKNKLDIIQIGEDE